MNRPPVVVCGEMRVGVSRAFSALLLCLAVQISTGSAWGSALASKNIDKPAVLRERLALDEIPVGDVHAGVVMDWSSRQMSGHLDGGNWNLVSESVSPHDNGEMKRSWTWRDGAAVVDIDVFVSSTGSAPSRDRLVRLATSNTRSDMPFVLGPAGLGDVSAIYSTGRGYERLIWAYGNVCVSIKAVDAPDFDAVPLARAIQNDLAHNWTPDLKRFMPIIADVALSSGQAEIGAPLEIESIMDKTRAPMGEWLSEVMDRDTGIWVGSGNGLEARVRNEEGGARKLMMLVADSATLLSARADFVVDADARAVEIVQ